MALSIRRGATRVFLIGLDGCTSDNYIWRDFDATKVRMRQGNVIVDKVLTPVSNDATAGTIFLSEKDTLKFSSERKAELQVSSFKETPGHSLVLKSPVFEVSVLPSVWDTSVTNGVFTANDVSLLTPEYPAPIGHAVYDALHINIKEYSGIVAENAHIIEYIDVTIDGTMEGVELVYNNNTETLYSQ